MKGLAVDLKVCLETILFMEPNGDYRGGTNHMEKWKMLDDKSN